MATLAATVLIACGARTDRSAATAEDESQTRERTAYRQAVGGLGAGYLYQTYLVIGTAADLLGREALETPEAVALMETTEGMSRNVDEILIGVRKLPIGPADANTVNSMLHVNQLLMQQAESLRAFAESRTKENAMRFEARRKATWGQLSRLLNVPPAP